VLVDIEILARGRRQDAESSEPSPRPTKTTRVRKKNNGGGV